MERVTNIRHGTRPVKGVHWLPAKLNIAGAREQGNRPSRHVQRKVPSYSLPLTIPNDSATLRLLRCYAASFLLFSLYARNGDYTVSEQRSTIDRSGPARRRIRSTDDGKRGPDTLCLARSGLSARPPRENGISNGIKRCPARRRLSHYAARLPIERADPRSLIPLPQNKLLAGVND